MDASMQLVASGCLPLRQALPVHSVQHLTELLRRVGHAQVFVSAQLLAVSAVRYHRMSSDSDDSKW